VPAHLGGGPSGPPSQCQAASLYLVRQPTARMAVTATDALWQKRKVCSWQNWECTGYFFVLYGRNRVIQIMFSISSNKMQ